MEEVCRVKSSVIEVKGESIEVIPGTDEDRCNQ